MSDDRTFQTCYNRGICGAPDHQAVPQVYGRALSDASGISKGDLILLFRKTRPIAKIYGFFRAASDIYYDDNKVWDHPKHTFPYRVNIEGTQDMTFERPLEVSDLYELAERGLLWIFQPREGQRDIVPLASSEVREILRLFHRNNPRGPVRYSPSHPYQPKRQTQLPISCENEAGKITGKGGGEYHLLSHLRVCFRKALFKEKFGNYTDVLALIPTSYAKELDMVLLHETTISNTSVLTHATLIELKQDSCTIDDLGQLLQYEEWLVRKKFQGDSNMVSTALIGFKIGDDAKEYVSKRKRIERRNTQLFEYRLSHPCDLSLYDVAPKQELQELPKTDARTRLTES